MELHRSMCWQSATTTGETPGEAALSEGEVAVPPARGLLDRAAEGRLSGTEPHLGLLAAPGHFGERQKLGVDDPEVVVGQREILVFGQRIEERVSAFRRLTFLSFGVRRQERKKRRPSTKCWQANQRTL